MGRTSQSKFLTLAQVFVAIGLWAVPGFGQITESDFTALDKICRKTGVSETEIRKCIADMIKLKGGTSEDETKRKEC